MFVCQYNLEEPAVHVYFLDIFRLLGGVSHRSGEGTFVFNDERDVLIRTI